MFGFGKNREQKTPLVAPRGAVAPGATDDVNSIIFWSIMSGCCPLIPVPLVDGICEEAVRHLMVSSTLQRCGLDADLVPVHTLSSKEPATCLECGMKVAYYGCGCFLLEFCFKKICCMFTVKNCVENASELFHQAWLLQYAIKIGHVSKHALRDRVAIWRVSTAINSTCHEVDTSPLDKVLGKALGGNKGKLREAASTVQSSLEERGFTSSCCPGCGPCCNTSRTREAVREAVEHVESETREELGGLTDSLVAEIKKQQPYLQKVEAVFVEKLKTLQDEEARPPACCCCWR